MDLGSHWRAIQQASSVLGRGGRSMGHGSEASSSAGGTILTHLLAGQQEEENDDTRRVDVTPFPSYLSGHQAVAAVAPEYGHIQAAFLPSTHAAGASTSTYTMPFITLAEPPLVQDCHQHLQQMVRHDEKTRILSTTAQGVTPAVANALLAPAGSASSLPVSASPSTTSNSSAHDAVAGSARPAIIAFNRDLSPSRDDVGEVETYKAMISAHPSYPRLVLAYANCQKVGAPPEILMHLDEISRKCQNVQQRPSNFTSSTIGQDPELDEFMDVYCDMLHKYHNELIKPFKEATSFFRKMEHQLNALNKGSNLKLSQAVVSGINDPHMDAAGGAPGTSDDEDGGCGELDFHVDGEEGQHVVTAGGDCRRSSSSNDMMVIQHKMIMHEGGMMIDPLAEEQKIKELLMQHYKGQIGNLKQEFLKKKKKGKLPKEARDKLLCWWTQHYKWPYPSEAEKANLAETTGLDQKQINNWFINQRKRHWKPSEDMQLLMLDASSHSHHFEVDQAVAPVATTVVVQPLQVTMQDHHYAPPLDDSMHYRYQHHPLDMMHHHQSNMNFNVEHTI